MVSSESPNLLTIRESPFTCGEQPNMWNHVNITDSSMASFPRIDPWKLQPGQPEIALMIIPIDYSQYGTIKNVPNHQPDDYSPIKHCD